MYVYVVVFCVCVFFFVEEGTVREGLIHFSGESLLCLASPLAFVYCIQYYSSWGHYHSPPHGFVDDNQAFYARDIFRDA